jgi:hypothetical protein
MGMLLVNGYLAFKYLSPHLMTLQEFPNVIAQAMRVDKEAEADLPKGVCTQSVQQGGTSGRAVGAPAEHISHACVRGKSLGLGRVKGEGVCSICKYNHAAGICVACLAAAILGVLCWKTWATMLLSTSAHNAQMLPMSRLICWSNQEFRKEVFKFVTS